MYSEAELSDIDRRGLDRAIQAAAEAKATGNLAFGAVLFDADAVEQGSAYNTVLTTGDPTEHAETQLVRLVTARLTREELEKSTLYASCEPCAMCSGAIFSAGIRRVLYALPSARLRAIVGETGGARMPSLLLTTKEVLAAGEVESFVDGGFPIAAGEALFR
nr:nucleoside deaminase [Micromonospora sp. DSM 115978]